MNEKTDRDIWRRVLSCLSSALMPGDTGTRNVSLLAVKARGKKTASRVPADRGQNAGGQRRIRIIERRTACTLTVSWRDSTAGCYGDQVWVMAKSRKDAICALTGRLIGRGAAVYKPRFSKRNVPQNHDQMILASVVPSGDIFPYLKTV